MQGFGETVTFALDLLALEQSRVLDFSDLVLVPDYLVYWKQASDRNDSFGPGNQRRCDKVFFKVSGGSTKSLWGHSASSYPELQAETKKLKTGQEGEAAEKRAKKTKDAT